MSMNIGAMEVGEMVAEVVSAVSVDGPSSRISARSSSTASPSSLANSSHSSTFFVSEWNETGRNAAQHGLGKTHLVGRKWCTADWADVRAGPGIVTAMQTAQLASNTHSKVCNMQQYSTAAREVAHFAMDESSSPSESRRR